jgi:hypothetical protein
MLTMLASALARSEVGPEGNRRRNTQVHGGDLQPFA